MKKTRHIVSSFSYPLDAQVVLDVFDKIAETEKKSRSELILELITKHANSHGDGNPGYSLDQFNKHEFKAWPTAWEFWNVGFDKDLSDEEFLEMAKLIRNKSTLMDKRVKRLDYHWYWA